MFSYYVVYTIFIPIMSNQKKLTEQEVKKLREAKQKKVDNGTIITKSKDEAKR